jgi:hypothetical protein
MKEICRQGLARAAIAATGGMARKKPQASVLAEACLRALSDRVLSPETTSQIVNAL